MNLWFVSDIHLKTADERNSKLLLRFLHSLQNGERPVTHLFFLGDIFDLWVGGHKVFVKRWRAHLEIIDYLIKFKKVEVYFIEGNHDVHVAPYWQKILGAKVHTEAFRLKINNITMHLEHGDQINKKDETYLKYRALIRSTPLKMLGLYLPGKFWDALGNWLSKKSGENSRKLRAEQIEQMRSMLRQYAGQLVEQDDNEPDYIFTGHFHVRDEYVINKTTKISKVNKTIHAINLGSWLEDQVYVYYLNESGGEFQFLKE